MSHGSPTSILLNIGHAMDHWILVVFAYSWATNGTHSIKLVNRATSGHPRIDLDAFIRLVQG